MDEQQTQVQTVSASKTKMAIAVGFLGLAAFAAGFAGLRTSVSLPDLVFVKAGTTTEEGMNKFSITLQNSGKTNVSSPFILNIKLGDQKNIVKKLKVLNSVSGNNKGSYENLESETGSFDILVKNYNLGRGQSTTITYWFVIPGEYEADYLPFTYVWDTTNVVSEVNEANNTYKGKLDIVKMGLVKESNVVYEVVTMDTPTSTTKIEQIDLITSTSTSSSTVTEQLPDLIVKDFIVDRTSYVGMKHFDIVVKNIGNATAIRPIGMHQNFGTFVVQLYFLAEDGSTITTKWLSSDPYHTSSLSLVSGTELNISEDVQITDAIFNYSKKIKMKVDWLEGSVTSIAPFTYPGKGYILESNEDNNELTKNLES